MHSLSSLRFCNGQPTYSLPHSALCIVASILNLVRRRHIAKTETRLDMDIDALTDGQVRNGKLNQAAETHLPMDGVYLASDALNEVKDLHLRGASEWGGGFREPQTSEVMVRLGKADMPGFKMHKELADFFDMIEDEEKLAKWEKEEMPKTLELIELSRRTSSRGRKVKEWARKAIAKAEIDSCWRKKTWKAAAYVRKCRRWTNPWWFPTGWCSGGYYCNGRDREVLGLCHQDCNGWSDDGSSCTKQCGSNTVTPYTCSHLQCATDAGSCVLSALAMAFSIIDMLSNICPASKLKNLATAMGRAASTAAKKALVKEFAKSIAKELFKKAKKKVKNLMKQDISGRIQYMQEYVVDAILQEAAEAFAIERVRNDPQFSSLSIEDIARELDVIGVSGVIDAFSLDSCDNAALESFPSCYVGSGYQGTYSGIYWWMEDNCCGDVTDSGWHSLYQVHFMYCHPPSIEQWYQGYLSLPESPSDTEMNDDDPFSADDDGFYSDSNATFVDVLIFNNTLSEDMLFLCNECTYHDACSADQIGLNLTFSDSCQAAGCCSDEAPNSNLPDIDVHINNVLKATRSGLVTDDEPRECSECNSFCDDETNQRLFPDFYNHCIANGCCDGLRTTSTVAAEVSPSN